MPRSSAWSLLVVAVLLMTLVTAPAMAAKGGNGNGGSSSIWIQESLTASTGGDLHYMDAVVFGYEIGWNAVQGSLPWLRVECSQNDTLVYQAWRAAFEGGYGYGEGFSLGPTPSWTGGIADCTGALGHFGKNGRFRVKASIEFRAMS